MSAPPLLFDVADGIATLTLNEASQMNPISTGMRQGCLQACALSWRSASPGFEPGMDLRLAVI